MPSPPPFGRRGVQAAAASPVPYRPAPAPVAADAAPWASERVFEAPPSSSRQAATFVARLFSFEGRFSRRQYWLTRVCVIVLMRVLTLSAQNVSAAVKAAKTAHAVTPGLLGTSLLTLLFIIAALIVGLWIGLAAAVKRWHDRDKAGIWALLGFVPIVGWLWQLGECGFMDGTPGPNRFGPDPKGASSTAYHDKLVETFG